MSTEIAHPERSSMGAAPHTLRREAVPADRRGERSRDSVGLLEPRPGGPAEWIAETFGPGHPVRVFLLVILAGYAALVTATTSAGLLLTRVILDIPGVASWDESVNEWLERHRTSALVDLSWVGSTLAGGLVIPVVVGMLLVGFLALKHWRLAAFTLFTICVESGTYRVTSLIVHRDRPDVHRLESLPRDESFPSGHSAASVALFAGLLVLLASRLQHTAARAAAWTLAFAIPAFVVWARLLRGMHHPTDTAAGILMGVGALAVTVLACRASAAADRGGPS